MILLTFNILPPGRRFIIKESIPSDTIPETIIQNTRAILRSLERQGIRATFFIDVEMVPITESLIKQIADEYHEVGLLAERASAPELEKIKKETEKILGKQIRGIRACENQYPSGTLLSLGFTYRLEYWRMCGSGLNHKFSSEWTVANAVSLW